MNDNTPINNITEEGWEYLRFKNKANMNDYLKHMNDHTDNYRTLGDLCKKFRGHMWSEKEFVKKVEEDKHLKIIKRKYPLYLLLKTLIASTGRPYPKDAMRSLLSRKPICIFPVFNIYENVINQVEANKFYDYVIMNTYSKQSAKIVLLNILVTASNHNNEMKSIPFIITTRPGSTGLAFQISSADIGMPVVPCKIIANYLLVPDFKIQSDPIIEKEVSGPLFVETLVKRAKELSKASLPPEKLAEPTKGSIVSKPALRLEKAIKTHIK